MRTVEKVPVKFYSCNAGRLTNKMAILAHNVQKHKLDVIHISEAGLQKKVPMGLTGYTVVKLERLEQNRESLMYIRNDLYARTVRVHEPNKEKTGAEVIQMKMDTVLPKQIFGLYQETGKPAEAKEYGHNKLQKRVGKCTRAGQNMILMGKAQDLPEVQKKKKRSRGNNEE